VTRRHPPYVLVSGPGEATPEQEALARRLGHELARRGAIVLTGGLGGVMAAASEGAKQAGGTTVALLPGSDRKTANPHVDIAIPTGLGELRNGLLVRAADVVIAIPGGAGTRSEIALAQKTGVPVYVVSVSGPRG
jgi:uncharacterized protein (TIGR00725 family)